MQRPTFQIPDGLDRKKPHIWLASWFGCGFISPAPGTWGTIGALPFGMIIISLGGVPALAIATILITTLGLWAAHCFDAEMDGHDSKMIVIDEVAGMWIALLPTALNPLLVILSFVLFRAFDIAKPWPVRVFDREIGGAAGVMGDDLVAGFMAAFCVWGISWFL